MRVHIPGHFISQIHSYAEASYPYECCGVIIGGLAGGDKFESLIPCVNVQDQYHREDPHTFPRNSEAAYLIDPNQLLQIHKKLRNENKAISLIYHSHVDAGAYFSDEDKRMAMYDDKPLYPGACYYVVSVIRGKAKNGGLFGWSYSRKDFLAYEMV